jgi:hypothetical protein
LPIVPLDNIRNDDQFEEFGESVNAKDYGQRSS